MRLHVTVELKENIQSENLGGQGWPGSLHSSSQLAVSKAHLTGVSLGYSPLGYSKNMWISRRHNRCNQPPKTAHVLKKRTETRDNHGPPSPVPPTKKTRDAGTFNSSSLTDCMAGQGIQQSFSATYRIPATSTGGGAACQALPTGLHAFIPRKFVER